MANKRVEMLLERNKHFNTPLSPPVLSDVRKKIRGSGVGGLVILSCSDPRVIPEQYFEMGRGEAAIIRNAGGRASDAIRSICTLDAIVELGTIIVVHHTDCGTSLVLDEEVRETLKARAPEHAEEINKMKFGEITDVDESVREDVELLRSSPFISKNTNILGFNLDIKTGLLAEVK